MRESKSLSRVAGVDWLKAICSFLIVSIHFPFSGNIGSVLLALARVAVPSFFMISGYFLFDSTKNKALFQSTIKTLKLIVCGSVLMLVVNSVTTLAVGGEVTEYLIDEWKSRTLVEVILKNKAYVCGPLWYLYALVYVLVIVGIFQKRERGKKILFAITPLLLLLGPILGKYSIIVLNRSFALEDTRNYLFTGLPYFILGALIRRKTLNTDYIQKYKKFFILGIPLFSATTVLEGIVLKCSERQGVGDLYFSTSPLCLCLFVFSLFIYDSKQFNRKLNLFIEMVGRECSLFVYLVHPAVATILKLIIEITGSSCMKLMFDMIGCIFIFIITLGLALGFRGTISRIHRGVD